jgi:NAD(P)-dependent dehydrogenase (short-subunit alcohol dehydrogenase family)
MNTSVVLITGALSGIGRATAVAFVRNGAKVFVAGRDAEAGNELVEELRSLGTQAEFINADVRKEDEVRSMVDQTVARTEQPRTASPRRLRPTFLEWC